MEMKQLQQKQLHSASTTYITASGSISNILVFFFRNILLQKILCRKGNCSRKTEPVRNRSQMKASVFKLGLFLKKRFYV